MLSLVEEIGLLHLEIVLEFLSSQRVLLVNCLFLCFLVVFLEYSPGTDHRHIALFLPLRHLPLLPHFVLEISVFILHVCHIIMGQQFLERKISSREAFGIKSLLLLLSFAFLLVKLLSGYERGELCLSSDTCGASVGRVRISTVVMSALDLKIGAIYHERVVDFLERLLIHLLCSVGVLLQGDEKIGFLDILHEGFVVQFLSVIGLRLLGL